MDELEERVLRDLVKERDGLLKELALSRRQLARAQHQLAQAHGALRAFVKHWDGYDDEESEWYGGDPKGCAILKQARAALTDAAGKGNDEQR